MLSFIETCEEACYEASKNLNKGFEKGNYGIKGCYGYSEGGYSGTFYYGTGGDVNARKAAVGNGKYRPEGSDCE